MNNLTHLDVINKNNNDRLSAFYSLLFKNVYVILSYTENNKLF